ncbi:DUF5719 family protein [Plantibacter sp. Mn2098]|uniref:DUF5719 family protein n=1 Tax=Plantibacter sp. Mn2098 TaxID=3395266 RepID=UPI003BC7E104
MPTKRGVAITSGRIVAGIVGIGIAAVTIAAAGRLDLPNVTIEPQSILVNPIAGDQSIVCPGPLLALAQNADAATAVGSFGQPSTEYAAQGDTATTQSIVAPDNTSASADGGPLVVTVKGGGDHQTPLSGAQSQRAAQAEISGLAAAACNPSSGEAWLVGGSSDTGRTTLVLLSNPSAVDANVSLEIFGANGRIEAPGATGIVVPPNTQRVVPLTGLAPNEVTPVVHVTSQGGQIVAALQQSTVRVLTPGGVEVVGPTTSPSTAVTIPGLVVTSPAGPAASSDTTSVDDRATALRLLAPGTQSTRVVITAFKEDGTAAMDKIDATLTPGVPGEIALADLPVGTFTLQVTADHPIVAAARSNSRSEQAEDFAWFAGSSSLDADFVFSTPTGPGPVLHLFNSTTVDATVEISTGSGTPVTAKVKAGSAGVVPVQGGQNYQVSGRAGLYASVSLASPGAIASFPVNPPNPLAAPIEVHPR